MIRSHTRSGQPAREAWTRERLLRERTIALGLAIDKSTLNSYSSALNKLLTHFLPSCGFMILLLNLHPTHYRFSLSLCHITLIPDL